MFTTEIDILSKVWVEFGQWADELITFSLSIPNLSKEYDLRRKGKIEGLQSAKINLQRIIKNYVEG